MKVTRSDENDLRFDNGLEVSGWHNQDCCEDNYIDFEQFQIGDEFPDCNSAQDFLDTIIIKEDGFILKDILGIPKWAQARSEQNGYYSSTVGITVEMNGQTISTDSEVLCG